MKNPTIVILLAALFISANLSAQVSGFSSLKNRAITVSPYQAFTQKGEMQLGFEKQTSAMSSWEFNIGFRFKESDAPQLAPYFHQTPVSSTIGTVNNGVQFFLFIPIPVTGRDEDWTEKTEHKEYYTNSNYFLSTGYKMYLTSFRNKKVPGGLYLTPGLTIGKKSISEYVYSEGQKGYVQVLDSDWSPTDPNPWGIIFGTGFIGTTKVVQEDVYDFTRLEIKEYTKSYFRPHLKLGVQLPIASHFSLDLGGQATFQGRLLGKSSEAPIKLEPTLKLSMWF